MKVLKTIIHILTLFSVIAIIATSLFYGPGWFSQTFITIFEILTAVIAMIGLLLKIVASSNEDPNLNSIALTMMALSIALIAGKGLLF